MKMGIIYWNDYAGQEIINITSDIRRNRAAKRLTATPTGGNSDQNLGRFKTQHFVTGLFFFVNLLFEFWVEPSDMISDPLDPLETKEIEAIFSVLKQSFRAFVLSKFPPRMNESCVYIVSLKMPSNSAMIANMSPNVTRNPLIIIEFWNCFDGTFVMYENEYRSVSESDKEFRVLRSENRSNII